MIFLIVIVKNITYSILYEYNSIIFSRTTRDKKDKHVPYDCYILKSDKD